MITLYLRRAAWSIARLEHRFTTADVLRQYIGHFHCDIGTPAHYSFNAQFGRWLVENRVVLQIEVIQERFNIRDDDGRRTQATQWSKLPVRR